MPLDVSAAGWGVDPMWPLIVVLWTAAFAAGATLLFTSDTKRVARS